MPHDPSQDENPYASPASTIAAGVEPDGRIYPSKAPVDVLDIAIGAVYATLALAVVMGIPFGISLGLEAAFNPVSPELAFAIALLLFGPGVLWYAWVLSQIVVSVTADDDGLHFQRRFRSSEDWPWATIVAIRPATRREVAWDGWIRPLLNPRERTTCMSALGHYRIQGTTDYCFFPPKNPEAFVEAVARYHPDLLEL